MNKKNAKNKIPEFKNYEEEAKFWDTHDITDYLDEFRPAKVRFAKNLSDGITVRFDSGTLGLLRAQARESGIGPTTLIRMWVIEKLRAQAHGHTIHTNR